MYIPNKILTLTSVCHGSNKLCVRIYFLLLLLRVFAYTVKPIVWVMTYSEYLANLNSTGDGREICDMQPWITRQNHRVGWSIDIVRISVSREDFFDIQAIRAFGEIGKNWYCNGSFGGNYDFNR